MKDEYDKQSNTTSRDEMGIKDSCIELYNVVTISFRYIKLWVLIFFIEVYLIFLNLVSFNIVAVVVPQH